MKTSLSLLFFFSIYAFCSLPLSACLGCRRRPTPPTTFSPVAPIPVIVETVATTPQPLSYEELKKIRSFFMNDVIDNFQTFCTNLERTTRYLTQKVPRKDAPEQADQICRTITMLIANTMVSEATTAESTSPTAESADEKDASWGRIRYKTSMAFILAHKRLQEWLRSPYSVTKEQLVQELSDIVRARFAPTDA